MALYFLIFFPWSKYKETEQNCPTCLVLAKIFRWAGFNIQILNATWRLFFFSKNSAFVIASCLCKKTVCTFFSWSCKIQKISFMDIGSDSNILSNKLNFPFWSFQDTMFELISFLTCSYRILNPNFLFQLAI